MVTLTPGARYAAIEEIASATKEMEEIINLTWSDQQLHDWMTTHGWALTDDDRDWRWVGM